MLEKIKKFVVDHPTAMKIASVALGTTAGVIVTVIYFKRAEAARMDQTIEKFLTIAEEAAPVVAIE